MKHIKLFETFMDDSEIQDLIDDLDEIGLGEIDLAELQQLLEILDFPRQTDEGHLVTDGKVSISKEINTEPGAKIALAIIERNPSVLKNPKVLKLLDEWMVDTIKIDRGKDSVEVTYKPMSRQAYDDGDFESNDGSTYEEYLENW